MTKEEVYDSEIFPLMAQIIAICNEHKVPMFASFTLDKEESLHCTTALLDDDFEPSDELVAAASQITNRRVPRQGLRVTTRNGKGEIIKDEVIL